MAETSNGYSTFKETSSKVVVESRSNDVSFRYKMIKQIYLVTAFIFLGLSSQMAGPVLPDLTERIGVNYEEISRALIGTNIGVFIGCIFGGFLHEVFSAHTDLINAFSMFLMATGAFIIPWSVSVSMAFMGFLLGGMSEGLLNTGSHPMIMQLWGDKAAAPLHSLHFGYGLGAVLAPQLARPFLSPEIDNITNTTASTPEDDPSLSRIEIPYSIVGIFIILYGCVSLLFYFKRKPVGNQNHSSRTSFKEMANPGSCTDGDTVYGIFIFTCLFFYFLNVVGGEVALGIFLFSYSYELNILTKDQSSMLMSIYWVSYTTGRLLGIPITAFINLDVVMTIDVIYILISAIILAVFAESIIPVFVIFTALIGSGMALAFPNGMSWSNLYLSMNSIGIMVLILGGSVGGIIYQYITGYLFENQGPQTLMYVMVAYGSLLFISYVVMVTVNKLFNSKKSRYIVDRQYVIEVAETTDHNQTESGRPTDKYQTENLAYTQSTT